MHRDDRLWLEFSAPKALYVRPASPHETPLAAQNYEGLTRFRASARRIVPDVGLRSERPDALP